MRRLMMFILMCAFLIGGMFVDESDAARKKKATSFRKALVTAAKTAAAKGDITGREYRKIRIVSLWPRMLGKMEAECFAAGVAAGEIPIESQIVGFDWDSLLAFIEKLLPLILQLIDLFSDNVSAIISGGTVPWVPNIGVSPMPAVFQQAA